MKGFTQHRDFLVSDFDAGRWRIQRVETHMGRRYCAWDWFPDDGDVPRVIATRDSAAEARDTL